MLLTLLDEMDRKLFTPSVCVAGGGPLVDELKNRGVGVLAISGFKGLTDISFLKRLIGVVRAESPCLIHSHVWLANLYSGICGRMLGVPVVATFHSKNEIDSFKERMALRLLARWCRAVVFVCAAQQKYFSAKAPIPGGRVIHNGLRTRDVSEQSTPEAGLKLRQTSGFESNVPLVVCVANFRPVKGHETLLRAWSLVHKQLPAAKLVLVGDGDCRPALTTLCKELGLSECVLFLGNRENVIEYLAIADVFVSPSLSECLSYAIMEAMSVGCPIVATDVGGNGDLISHEVDGLLVPPANPQSMAQALCRLLSDKQVARRLGDGARTKVAAMFTGRKMTDQYESLYLETLAG